MFPLKSAVTNCCRYFFAVRLRSAPCPDDRDLETLMKRAAVALLMIGSLSVAGQASAHGGGDGGAVVGALIGGAVLGAIVGSAATAAPVYAAPVYAQPVYTQPVYTEPAYAQPAPPPPGYCFDNYRRAYVPCGPAYAPGY
jgi:hypothetical protein